jgi:hypothetical protein
MSAIATLLSTALLAGVGLPAESPSRTVECEDAAAGVGAAPPGAARLGPFRMPGREERHAHWNPATKRFSSKVPVVVVGARAVTVSVPERLSGRLVMVYGGAGRRRFAEEITFVPCAGRPATFFPGGMLFTRREPIALLVQPEGWAGPRALNLGVFAPR